MAESSVTTLRCHINPLGEYCVNKLIRFGIVAAFVGVGTTGVALADSASTTGGIKIKSDDGNFDASIGGRVHFDAVYLDPDGGAYNKTNAAGSGAVENNSGTYFRRVFLTLQGTTYGWGYKIETNMAGNTASGGNDFQDVFISHQLGGKEGKMYVGQHKPWRSLEELGSNNSTLFMERPVTTASGIFGGRDFQQGLFYSWQNKDLFGGAAIYSLHKDGAASTEGTGYNARLIWSPINDATKVAHIGGSYSSDHADNNAALSASYRIAGYRLGTGTVTETLATYGGAGLGGASADTYNIEAAGMFGPVFLNGEYASSKFKVNTKPDATVDGYYVQASWFVTGESKTYGADKTFGNPKPKNAYGAIELKARYEYAENSDVTSTANPGNCTSTGAPSSGRTQCELSDIAVGFNYYVNPNVRFMFDYVAAEANLGDAGKDSPNTFAGRVQLAF
jgi:phosphate-selective porin OprO/OprP